MTSSVTILSKLFSLLFKARDAVAPFAAADAIAVVESIHGVEFGGFVICLSMPGSQVGFQRLLEVMQFPELLLK